MNDKQLLIVGIDPGITTALAVLDVNGNLVYLESSKHLELSMLISKTLKLGKVVLVGTDKYKVPKLIGAFATKLGARIVSPEEDLQVDEKKIMMSYFTYGDEHQRDALACALFAYKSLRALLAKIDYFIKANNKQDIKDKIIELVVTKKISIKSAVDLIEKKNEINKITEKTIVEKLIDADSLRLRNKLKKYEREIKLLKNYNNKLKNKIINIESTRAHEPKEESRKTIDFRENRIKFLENLLKQKGKNIEDFQGLIKKFNNIISNINNYYVLKKLETLGINEFKFKNKILNIQQNDILIIENPNIISKETVELLKNIVFLIVCKKTISKKMENTLPFLFIDAKNLKIYEDRYFCFVEKSHFDAEKTKSNWIQKIVEGYRHEKELISR